MNPIDLLTSALAEAQSWEIVDLIIAISIGLASIIALFRLSQEEALEDDAVWLEDEDESDEVLEDNDVLEDSEDPLGDETLDLEADEQLEA